MHTEEHNGSDCGLKSVPNRTWDRKRKGNWLMLSGEKYYGALLVPIEANRAGYLKAVWPEISGPVFGRFSAKLGPKTPLDRRGSSCSAGCTKNQPRRPILRQFRGAKQIPARLPSGTQAVKPLGEMIMLVLVFWCFGLVFGQSWPQDPFKRVRLDKWCRTRPKLTPETNSRVVS